jgi:hypothetical protein
MSMAFSKTIARVPPAKTEEALNLSHISKKTMNRVSMATIIYGPIT